MSILPIPECTLHHGQVTQLYNSDCGLHRLSAAHLHQQSFNKDGALLMAFFAGIVGLLLCFQLKQKLATVIWNLCHVVERTHTNRINSIYMKNLNLLKGL